MACTVITVHTFVEGNELHNKIGCFNRKKWKRNSSQNYNVSLVIG